MSLWAIDESAALFIYMQFYKKGSVATFPEKNIKLYSVPAAASHQKNFIGKTQIDFYYEVVTGNAVRLSVSLGLLFIKCVDKTIVIFKIFWELMSLQ